MEKTFHKVAIQWKLCACIMKNFPTLVLLLENLPPHPQTARSDCLPIPPVQRWPTSRPARFWVVKIPPRKLPAGRLVGRKHQGQPKRCNQTTPFCSFFYLLIEHGKETVLVIGCDLRFIQESHIIILRAQELHDMTRL